MVDYSKWDHIEVSDDEGEDCHPNIDKKSWIKWKKEAKELKKQEELAEKKKRQELREKNLEEIKKVEATLAESGNEELKKKLETLKKKEEEFKKKQQEEEEYEKKHPVWNEDTICHDGFSKTIITKKEEPKIIPLSKKEEIKEKKTEEKVEAKKEGKVEEKEKEKVKQENQSESQSNGEQPKDEQIDPEEEENRRVEEYVKSMEIKAHKFAQSKNYQDYFKVISEFPEIVCSETHQYLLLHASDFLKNNHDDLSKQYLKAACIVNYCLELGKDGTALFFARMRDSNPKYRQEFEHDTLQYWERIREKLTQLGKVKGTPQYTGTQELTEEDVAE